MAEREPLLTPDGRYLVVRGRLWRRSDPRLEGSVREQLVKRLMQARRDVAAALRSGNDEALRTARSSVQVAKVALGERGPVWWDDGAPDLTRRLARNTAYAGWFVEAGGEVD